MSVQDPQQLLLLLVVLAAATKIVYERQPFHDSILTGRLWVQELLHGHPERMYNELGMYPEMFLHLIRVLRELGYTDSRNIMLEEQLAIFLFTCRTGNSVRHVAERFQHANGTITKYFKKMLRAFSSKPFYTTYVRLPTADAPVPPAIYNNPRFYPYLAHALGACDGTQIHASPPSENSSSSRNRKGWTSINVLACCTFSLLFVYVLSGMEGAATDSFVFDWARRLDFTVPEGRYYLGDAGYGFMDSLLVPYRGVRYHLAEWGRANVKPANKEELFNLRHAVARNCIERIFGVLKKRFPILRTGSEYSMEDQARLPPALCALHNFIRLNDPEEINNFLDANGELHDDDVQPRPANTAADPAPDVGSLSEGPARREERARAKARREVIAQAMWDDYQRILRERGAEGADEYLRDQLDINGTQMHNVV